jgi:hypothetical protein
MPNDSTLFTHWITCSINFMRCPFFCRRHCGGSCAALLPNFSVPNLGKKTQAFPCVSFSGWFSCSTLAVCGRMRRMGRRKGGRWYSTLLDLPTCLQRCNSFSSTPSLSSFSYSSQLSHTSRRSPKKYQRTLPITYPRYLCQRLLHSPQQSSLIK